MALQRHAALQGRAGGPARLPSSARLGGPLTTLSACPRPSAQGPAPALEDGPSVSGRCIEASANCLRRIRAHAARPGHSWEPESSRTMLDASTLQLPPLMLDPCLGHLPSLADMQEILPHLSPKQLADTVWAFAKHDVKPTKEFMNALSSEICTKLSGFRCQDLSNTLWAFAMLSYQPDAKWWGEFERQVYLNLTDFSDRELSNLLWSLAVLGQQPAWLLDNLLSCSAEQFDTYNPTSLHLVIWSLGKLGYVPSDAWLQSYLRASQANFFKFTIAELANILWAMARLGVKLPQMWVDNFLMVAQWRFPSFSARLLSIVVWSTATLNHRPQQDWLVSFEEQVREKFGEFTGHELACVAWALRKFGYTSEDNAVFYLLDKQQNFLESDFEILSNTKLLKQLITWKGSPNSPSSPTGPWPSSQQ